MGRWMTRAPILAIRPDAIKPLAKKVIRAFFLQGLAALLNFAIGIGIVRGMPRSQYALYTVINLLISTFVIISESGVGYALIAIAGRESAPSRVVSELVSVGRRWLRYLNVLAGVIVLPLALTQARPVLQAGWAWALGLALIMTAGCVTSTNRLQEAAVKALDGQAHIVRWQFVDAGIRAGALVGLLLTGWLAGLSAGAVLLVSGIVISSLQASWLRRMASPAPGPVALAPTDRAEFRRTVLRQMPSSIYFALQGQLSVLLLAVFAHAEQIADLGAISRFAAAFSIIGAVINLHVYPWFSRAGTAWRSRFWLALGSGSAAFAAIPIVGLVAPGLFLYLLGPTYHGLKVELQLLLFSQAFGGMVGLAWALLAHIGRSRFAIYSPLISIVFQAGCISFLNLSSLTGVIALQFVASLPALMTTLLEYRVYSLEQRREQLAASG